MVLLQGPYRLLSPSCTVVGDGEVVIDPKPEKRIRDPEASRRKLLEDPHCRICGRAASDGHHIVLRSKSGDDVPENVLPLCHQHHMEYHAGVEPRLKLTLEEFQYVIRKLGREAGLAYMQKRRLVK